uniref:Uncharacterized protein n=1 Tax=Trypanosoma vivax (strain Y486) TaxID=1055687 RepID=G0U8X2_TRYVY|nr:conserved hypothetical protein, fragment [Trypanosoma vivax Y486]
MSEGRASGGSNIQSHDPNRLPPRGGSIEHAPADRATIPRPVGQPMPFPPGVLPPAHATGLRQILPPGVKMMKGPPPPGAKLVVAPGSLGKLIQREGAPVMSMSFAQPGAPPSAAPVKMIPPQHIIEAQQRQSGVMVPLQDPGNVSGIPVPTARPSNGHNSRMSTPEQPKEQVISSRQGSSGRVSGLPPRRSGSGNEQVTTPVLPPATPVVADKSDDEISFKISDDPPALSTVVPPQSIREAGALKTKSPSVSSASVKMNEISRAAESVVSEGRKEVSKSDAVSLNCSKAGTNSGRESLRPTSPSVKQLSGSFIVDPRPERKELADQAEIPEPRPGTPQERQRSSTSNMTNAEKGASLFIDPLSDSPPVCKRTARSLSTQQLTVPADKAGAPLVDDEVQATPQPAISDNVRKIIVQQFLTTLCPQQLHGKVTKLHHIHPIVAERDRAPGLREHSTIFVVSKGSIPNQYFYPQLRLMESEGTAVTDDKNPGQIDMPLILCEAAPGNMFFATTEEEAKSIFESDQQPTSCFIASKSAIVFRDPVKHVLPKAMLTVRWVPYSTPESEPQCQVHRKELQLFNSYTRELCCSLCVAQNGGDMSHYVVIPDVLRGDSRRRVTEAILKQLHLGKQSAERWVNQHKRIVAIAKRKKEAVAQQFDLLMAAIKSKKEEILEYCDSSFGLALSAVAKEILLVDEKVHLLQAAVEHLRRGGSKPLYSMQIATVANAVTLSEDSPWNFSMDAVDIPTLISELTPNLEGVMTEIQLVSPGLTRSAIRCNGSTSDISPSSKPNIENNPVREKKRVMTLNRKPEVAPRTFKQISVPTRLMSTPLQGRRDVQPSKIPSRPVGRSISPNKRAQPTALPRNTVCKDDVPSNVGNNIFTQLPPSKEWIVLPGCRGTCIFNVPLHSILKNLNENQTGVSRAPTLQWTLRIDDPGDWLGIGVGVGGDQQTWQVSGVPDLSHLWVVPDDAVQQKFVLRVTLSPRIGHAKLSIHDNRGRRLDDNNIPQWRATRSCYPQVTFGGRIGVVRLVEGPSII